MSEPKRWTVPASVCPAALGNGYPEVNVIAAEDYDRLREERDRLAEASETLAARDLSCPLVPMGRTDPMSDKPNPTGVPYPPNPPENPPHPFIPGSPGWLAYERGRAAADSWWRSRLVSDETVEAVAKVIAGPAKCCCDDDWRLPPSRVCPVHGEGSWPYQSHYAKARAVLAALLPVAGGSGGRSAPGNFRAANLPAEKPETDTSPEPIPDSEFVEPPLMPPDPISERMIDVADDAFRHGSSDEQAWRECLGDALHAVYPLIRERVIAEASQGKRPANPEPETDT